MEMVRPSSGLHLESRSRAIATGFCSRESNASHRIGDADRGRLERPDSLIGSRADVNAHPFSAHARRHRCWQRAARTVALSERLAARVLVSQRDGGRALSGESQLPRTQRARRCRGWTMRIVSRWQSASSRRARARHSAAASSTTAGRHAVRLLLSDVGSGAQPDQNWYALSLRSAAAP